MLVPNFATGRHRPAIKVRDPITALCLTFCWEEAQVIQGEVPAGYFARKAGLSKVCTPYFAFLLIRGICPARLQFDIKRMCSMIEPCGCVVLREQALPMRLADSHSV